MIGLRNVVIVAMAAIMPGVCAAIAEYILTGGSSGWIPVISGAIGGVPTLVVLLYMQRRLLQFQLLSSVFRQCRLET